MANWKREPGNCQKCGMQRPYLQRDRIVPGFLGGIYEPSNIQYLCANCHEDKTRAELSGIKRSKEAKEKMRSAALGRHHTEEAKKKIGEASKGNQYALGNVNGPRPEEVKEKIREKMIGIPHSEERKANQAAAAQNRFSDPEKKAAWYAARWGKKKELVEA
jgi:hypothetical protein